MLMKRTDKERKSVDAGGGGCEELNGGDEGIGVSVCVCFYLHFTTFIFLFLFNARHTRKKRKKIYCTCV